jgi:hypothetical protein
MNVNKIQRQSLSSPSSGELSEIFIHFCEFCFKKCSNEDQNYNICKKLSGDDVHFCEFCLRNNFQRRKKNNILILTFKTIIAWYYYQNYLSNYGSKMWFHDIIDYIEKHKFVGLKNPLFVYDEQTMLWFIDFNRIGVDGNKINFSEIKKTVVEILSVFDLEKNVKSLNVGKFISKYKKCIDKFYKIKEIPNGKMILDPTFNDCFDGDFKISTEKLKNFSFINMECKKYS